MNEPKPVTLPPSAEVTEQEMLKAWDAYVESPAQTPTRLPTYDAFEAGWNARYESSNLLLREEIERLRKEAFVSETLGFGLAETQFRPRAEAAEQELATLREENERLKADLASGEASCLEEIKNRDDWEERATNLANAVGECFNVPVGEHSNMNCPIGEAHKILNGEYKTKFTLRASASSERVVVLEGALTEVLNYARKRPDNHPKFSDVCDKAFAVRYGSILAPAPNPPLSVETSK